jgi:hypothetical protein
MAVSVYPDVGELLERLDAQSVALDVLQRRVLGLEAQVQRLAAGEGPRDAADGALRQLLPASTETRWFKSSELDRHAVTDAPLREALVRADCISVDEIGLWLRRSRGNYAGVLIERHRRRWRAVYTSST